jgi:hypothetical protein
VLQPYFNNIQTCCTEAAENLNLEAVSKVRKALTEELLPALPSKSEKGGEVKKEQDTNS